MASLAFWRARRRSAPPPLPLRSTPLSEDVLARRLRRLALWGALLGGVLALGAVMPARWLASAVEHATAGRLQLRNAQGLWWNGDALPLLTGGPGSRDALLIPSRLHWQLGLGWRELRLTLQQDCCLPQGLTLRVQPGWGQARLELSPVQNVQWPAQWVEGLGAPWNTLKPGGLLSLDSPGLTLELASGQAPRLQGQVRLTVQQASSRMSTLAPLGSYQVRVQGQGERPVGLHLSTQTGPLQLQGTGEIGPHGLRFRGTASPDEGYEAALNNLLNLIGRRQGAQSLFSIG